jgi:hypothetical protein
MWSARRTVSCRTAAAACALSAVLGGGAYAGASTLATGAPIKPGPPFVITGYGYSCQSTLRTPNFSCDYGRPYARANTPIMTIWPASRAMYVQSLSVPKITKAGGVYTSKFTR